MPPSEMTVTPRARQTSATSWMALNCGMPTPEMTRVVQMDAGADADLDRRCSCIAQISRAILGHDVAGDDGRPVAELFAQIRDHVDHARGVAGGRVDEDRVRARGLHGQRAVDAVLAHTHRGAHEQPAVVVLRGVGEGPHLLDVLLRDQSGELSGGIHQRKLFDAVDEQHLERLLGRRVRRPGGQPFARRHDLLDRSVLVLDIPHVAAGHHAHQRAGLVHHGKPADAALAHEQCHIAQGRSRDAP